jgi:hypothetical protein
MGFIQDEERDAKICKETSPPGLMDKDKNSELNYPDF